jgi:hypothetical protein
MEHQLNEVFVKMTSLVPFPKEIGLGEDVTVVIDGQNYTYNCVKQEVRDKQDGTYDLVCVLKSLSE